MDHAEPVAARLSRADLTARLVAVAGDALIVGGIGNALFDLFHASDRATNFYMMGSMGLATPIGLGLALAQPERPVVVLEGDGSLLMNLGVLATIGRERPENLTVIVWDNGQWQLTGGQATASATTCDLTTVARGCGIASSTTPADSQRFESDVRHALDAPGPHLVVAKIDGSPAVGTHHDDPVRVKHRFMDAIGARAD